MKAQFMLLSAVISGLMLISLGAVISDVESQTFESQDLNHQIIFIEREASKLYEDGNSPDDMERKNFLRVLNDLDYRSSVNFGNTHVNVTLQRPGERYELQRLGE